MAQGRVQAPELQGNLPLRPAPIQSDTYAAPARPAANTNLTRLADALGSFSSSIGSLVPLMKPSDKELQDQAWAEQRKFSGWTRDDYVKAVEDGSIPNYDNQFAQKAIHASFGDEYGAHRVDQLQQDLTRNFDWDHGNVDQYLAQATKADIDKYGSDRNFGAAYMRRMDGLRTWAMDYATKRKSSDFVDAQNRAAFGFIDTMVDDGIKTGTDPRKIADGIYGQYANLGKDGTLGVDYKQLDQEVLNKARRIAATAPEVALALISHERPGKDGSPRSLMSNPDMQDTVLQIQLTAKKAVSLQEEQQFKTTLRDQNYQLLRHGNADQIADIHYKTLTGDEKTITVKQQQDWAEEDFQRHSQNIAKGNRETQPETLSRELRAYRLSGMKHPGLSSAVTGIADMASIDLEQDPEGRQKLLGKLKAYEWLQNESTASLLAYTKEPDRQFAETYLMAEKYLHQDPDTALSTAIRTTQVTKEGMESVQKYQREIDAQVNSLGTKPGWIWGTNSAEPANSSIAKQRVTNLAQTFVRLGLKPTDAVEQAAEAVKKTSITYNGVLLDMQGQDLPQNFSEALDDAIADYAKKAPLTLKRNDISQSDISVAPAPSGTASGGRLMLVDKHTMLPVFDDKGQAVFINLSQLRQSSKVKQEAKDRETVRNAALNSSIAAKGLVQAVDTDGKTYWVDKSTREIYTYSFGQKDSAPRWSKTGQRYKRGVLTTPQGGFVFGGKAAKGVGNAVHGAEAAAENGIVHHPLRYLWDGMQSGWDAVKDGHVQLGPVEIGTPPAAGK
ncbi:MAG: hypothetical protein ACTHJ3_19605 [Pararhizobium sp.]